MIQFFIPTYAKSTNRINNPSISIIKIIDKQISVHANTYHIGRHNFNMISGPHLSGKKTDNF